MTAKSGSRSIAKCHGILEVSVLNEFNITRATSSKRLLVSVSMVVMAPLTELVT